MDSSTVSRLGYIYLDTSVAGDEIVHFVNARPCANPTAPISAHSDMVDFEGFSLSATSRLLMPSSVSEREVLRAANLLRGMGASQVFVFGSFARGELRPDSDIDLAVSGLPAKVYFSAVSKVSDLLGRPVDLLDLDDDTPLVRYLLGSGELIRVD